MLTGASSLDQCVNRCGLLQDALPLNVCRVLSGYSKFPNFCIGYDAVPDVFRFCLQRLFDGSADCAGHTPPAASPRRFRTHDAEPSAADAALIESGRWFGSEQVKQTPAWATLTADQMHLWTSATLEGESLYFYGSAS